MKKLKALLYSDARVNAAEFATLAYPHLNRKPATNALNRVLTTDAPVPASLPPVVQKFLADVKEALGRPAASTHRRSMLALIRDARVQRKGFYLAMYPKLEASAASQRLDRRVNGPTSLSAEDGLALRQTFTTLAAALQEALADYESE